MKNLGTAMYVSKHQTSCNALPNENFGVKRVVCYASAETFTEAVASVASMVATPLNCHSAGEMWTNQ